MATTGTTTTGTTTTATNRQWIGPGTCKAISVADRFLDRKLPAFVIFFSFVVIALLIVRYSERAGPLQFIESVVLGVMAAFSTYNYRSVLDGVKKVKGRLNESVPDQEVFATNIFACINALLFAIALWSLLFTAQEGPHEYLFCVFLIFFAFTCSNLWQASRLCSCPDRFLLEVISWLRSENGPSLMGYAILVIVTAAFDSWYSVNGVSERIRHVEAFAAGAATFHLAISVVNFWLGVRPKSNPMDTALENIGWNDAKAEVFDKAKRAVRGWRKVLIACLACTLMGLSLRNPVAHYTAPVLIKAWQYVKKI